MVDGEGGLEVAVRALGEQRLVEDPSVEQRHALRVLARTEYLRGRQY